MDAAEEDRRGVGGGRLPREAERVADVVGDVLHLGQLVVVGEDHRVALARERAHLLGEASVSTAVISSTSSETSSERAAWVSAPTEMKSTPVSAYARTVASVMPPEASSGTRPRDELDGRADLVAAHVVEQDPVDAGLERLGDVVERLRLDLDRHVPLRSPSAATAVPIPPAMRRWFSLSRIAS